MTQVLDDKQQARSPLDEGPLADAEERKVIFAVLDSFRQYRKSSHYNTTHRRRQNLYALPTHQWKLLASPPFNLFDHLNLVDDAIDQNADIADAILSLGLENFGLPDDPTKGSELCWHGNAQPSDMAKAHSTIRQFYRDWSASGFAAETKPLLDLVRSALASTLPLPTLTESSSILLPGAGLGRLLFELSLVGYNVEGNEISYHQLLASNFVLNTLSRPNTYKLYPFANTFTNNINRADQLKNVLIPDVLPAAMVTERLRETGAVVGSMNMAAGDFLTSYIGIENKSTFDAVVTVYFIDTAPNLFRYIKTVSHVLKDEGIWINVGPLLWHFDDSSIESNANDQHFQSDSNLDQMGISDRGVGEPGSFELTNEEVLSLVEHLGFEIVRQEFMPIAAGGYMQNPDSMMQSLYRCSHWVARKLPDPVHTRQERV